MKTIGENPEKIDIDLWIEMLYETTNLFKKMGSAMSQAFSGKDETKKLNLICRCDIKSSNHP